MVAFATSQQEGTSGDPVMALYLCQANPAEKYATADSEVDPLEYTAFLAPRENVPNSKVVINLLSDGTYRGELGSIANPVEGDHSTGRLDRTISTELLRLDPEPSHVTWEYYESRVTEGQKVVPEFHCFMLRGEWWVVDIDRERMMYQQVAALEFADSPNHRRLDHQTPRWGCNRRPAQTDAQNLAQSCRGPFLWGQAFGASEIQPLDFPGADGK